MREQGRSGVVWRAAACNLKRTAKDRPAALRANYAHWPASGLLLAAWCGMIRNPGFSSESPQRDFGYLRAGAHMLGRATSP